MIETLSNALVAGAALALIAVGFASIYLVTRTFTLSYAAVYTVSAYCLYSCRKVIDLPMIACIVASILLAGLLGGAIDFVVYRRLRKLGATSLGILFASLGVMVVIQNAISMAFGDTSKNIRGPQIPERIDVLGLEITPSRLATMAAAVAAIGCTALIWRHSQLGRTVRAVAIDADLASIVGVDKERVILGATVFGSGLAGVAAVLQALDSDITPTMGFHAMLLAVVATVLGGKGNILGVACFGLFIGLAQNLIIWFLPGQWQDTVVFAILFAVLVARPTRVLSLRPRQVSN